MGREGRGFLCIVMGGLRDFFLLLSVAETGSFVLFYVYTTSSCWL